MVMILKSFYYRLRSVILTFNNKKIKIGRSVVVSSDSKLDNNVTLLDYSRVFKSKISSYSYVSPFSILINTRVGRYTSIGPGCRIGLGIHPLDGFSTSPYFYNDHLFKKKNDADFNPVNIGNDVWIGANVLIMGGVSIGDGCVIGAGSVVTKDLPPYSISVGIPAKVIKMRFSESEIERLLDSQWWLQEHNKLIQLKDYFYDLDSFLKLE